MDYFLIFHGEELLLRSCFLPQIRYFLRLLVQRALGIGLQLCELTLKLYEWSGYLRNLLVVSSLEGDDVLIVVDGFALEFFVGPFEDLKHLVLLLDEQRVFLESLQVVDRV